MKNDEWKLFMEIFDALIKCNLSIDAFLSGSTSRGEERKKENIIISDIDIIIVFDKINQLNKLKSSFAQFKKIGNRKISFVFVNYKYFINNLLSDYALSINFSFPIVKNLPYIYPNISKQNLDKQRWVYQLQSCLYYYSKYKIKKSLVDLCKAYLNSVKVEIYRNELQSTNNYILDEKVKLYSNNKRIKNNLIYYNLCYNYLYNSLGRIPVSQIESYLINWYSNLFVKYKMSNIINLNSVLYFMHNHTKNSLYVNKRHMSLVIMENPGCSDETLYQ